MDRRRFIVAGSAVSAGLIAGTGRVFAQTYPSRPVTLIVPFAAGGAGDLTARVVTDFAGSRRGVAAAPDFRPGAGATIGTANIAEAEANGLTLGLYSISPFGTIPYLQKVPYDPATDFTYISAYVSVPIAFYVKADSPFNSWEDVVRFATDNPGRLRWGTAAVRGAAHIATEAAFRKAGITATFVPFTGGAEAMTALLGGHIEACVSSDYGPQLDAGQVRLLAATGSQKIAGQESLPTFAELGQPLALEATYGLVAPAGISQEAVAFWNELIVELQKEPEYQTYLGAVRGTPLYWDSPRFTAEATEAYAKLGETLNELGFV
jgi:tripartite-type tricarboxylate transporter receptor subunit TctC